MSTNLHINLPDAMHRFVQERANGRGMHTTPSEYVRDLIRRDFESHLALGRIEQGVDDLQNGRFSELSFDDFLLSNPQ